MMPPPDETLPPTPPGTTPPAPPARDAADDRPSGREVQPTPEDAPSQRHRGLDSDDDVDPDVYEDDDDEVESDDEGGPVGDGMTSEGGEGAEGAEGAVRNPTTALLNALAEGFGLLEHAQEVDAQPEIGPDGRPVLRAIARNEDDGEAGPDDTPAVLPEEVAPILEAMLFTSASPLSPDRLRDLMGLDSIIPIRRAADRLRAEYDSRGRSFELVELAGGYILQTRPEFETFVTKLRRARQEQHMTHAALVTLAIIAYKQPITRTEIDSIRGAGSSHHLRNLMERDLVRVVGRKHAPGYPSLYGTTSRFLRQFGLRSLRDLPQEADFAETDVEAIRAASREDLNDGDDGGDAGDVDPGAGDDVIGDGDGLHDDGGLLDDDGGGDDDGDASDSEG
ncbi:MAG: SMC-Scp complex subunit ScpB [Planctomycetota bacterium]